MEVGCPGFGDRIQQKGVHCWWLERQAEQSQCPKETDRVCSARHNENSLIRLVYRIFYKEDYKESSPGSMHDTGCLGLVHWDDPEGWYGEGGGRRVQDGEHMYIVSKNKTRS